LGWVESCVRAQRGARKGPCGGRVSEEESDEELSNGRRPDGLDCFLTLQVCGPHCMAYLTYEAGKSTELNEQQRHCMLLVSLDRLARNTGVAAQAVTKQATAKRNKEADAQ